MCVCCIIQALEGSSNLPQIFPRTKSFRPIRLLLKECEELIAKGITGTRQGFDLPGRRLGGFSRQAPLSSIHQTALAAGKSEDGVELCYHQAALSPVQAAATAAEWRLHDDSWCGSKSPEGDIEVQGNVGTTQRTEPFTFTDGISTQTSIKPKPGQEEIDDQAKWNYSMCTLLNKPLTLSCAACGTLKEDVKFKVWSCKFCTPDNRVKLDRCLACREWRYSSAPPVPNRGPYVGT